ncbi:MAG TPA: lipopolysaccharide biosynthesis protein [Gallionella sp.]|nr:lipopolysaccharide biosynthesis protein [Gallionella sp.]
MKTRFLVSVGANGIRGVIGFFSGLLVARALSPSGYGDLMFLLGSFAAIRGLLDMGTSSAFYTFLSRHTQGRRFYLVYFFWMALQFLITLVMVAVIPFGFFEKIWLGHNREIVIVAFLAVFVQQQILQTVSQIGESMRKTIKVQLLILFAAVIYLIIIVFLISYGTVTTQNILFLTIFQGALASLSIYWVLRSDQALPFERDATLSQIVLEYWTYCKPLIVLSLITFLYDFADKWMLQKFGGATQQGFFQIANQFSNAILLATTSIIGIFWKEIAHAWEKRDHYRVAMLYRKTTRGLVMLSAIASGLLLPWAEQIVTILLGPMYVMSWPVLAIMFLYPIHLPMGIIGGSTLLAIGQTHKHMLICIVGMLVSMPISYLMLAPATSEWGGFGLGLGAVGLASKLVILSVVSVNVQAWVIARYNGWDYDWKFQVIGIPLMLMIGYLVKLLMGFVWDIDHLSVANLVIPALLVCFLYAGIVILSIWFLPWLIGLEKAEIEKMSAQVSVRIKSKLFNFSRP